MSKMEYSPKLRRVVDEIEQILEREKLTGLVCLHDHELQASEFSIKTLDHPENCIKLKDGQVLITTKDISFRLTKEKRINNTYNMACHFLDRVALWFVLFDDIRKKIEATVKVEKPYKPGPDIQRDGPSQSN